MRRLVYIVFLVLYCSLSMAQDVTVVRDYGGKRVVSDPSKYKLVGSSQHTVLIQHYELISADDREELVDVIIRNIDFYLDQVMEISEGKMAVRKSNQEIVSDLNRIVETNIQLYDYQVDERFKGFSDEFLQKIKLIEQLSWDANKAEDGTSTFNSQEMAYNYVKSQISRLKDISTSDLMIYAEAHIHEHTGDDLPMDLADLPADLDTSQWVVNSPLQAYDYQLAMIDVADVGLYLEPEVVPAVIPEGTNDKIVALLESNNQLITEFSKQMIAMQQEMIALRQEGNAFQQSYAEMRGDIRDLQVALEEVRESNQNVTSDPGLRPLDNEENYIVRFEKNSDEISLSYRMELNQVYYLLMTDPSRKVLVTGFADLSGNPEINAAISRKRALAVKRYLSQKGVDGGRMIVNYLGDAASNSENPDDRKVEIAWMGK